MQDTLTVIRQCVTPGMLVIHHGKPWRASVNKDGKLHIHTLTEAKTLKDLLVDIVLNHKNEPEII
ncbi:hypothetical protein ILP74_07570 [Citrobacter amalonaticus]|uniref:hypothetical protein n=1 Tax=Citrobacter amalonaticus TaxID=35703 RepID=UPI0017882804|nr:hypothetical protein [Citrobacter amalonaticus]MBE0395326.1 hypothetical protein [Citrobacter amalonaticus]